jgi:MraZ protein
MFVGQFYHNLDEKGRLTIPARFRELLPDGAFVMQGFDRNLMVLPASVFDTMSARVREMSITDPEARLLRRLLFSTAEQVEVDKAGRILISQLLRQFAGLANSLVVVGMADYFELWSPEAWAPQNEQIQDAQANAGRFADLRLTSA